MKTTINEASFLDAFQEDESRKNQFSYGALKAIFAFYERLEEDTGEEMELDTIATCCEFTEHENATEAMQQYSVDLQDLDIDWLDANEAEDEELIEKKAREWLEERTVVLDAVNVNSRLEKIKSIVVIDF